MIEFSHELFDFPKQKVSSAEKKKPSWYANCIDYVVAMGLSCNDMKTMEDRISILHGDIPDKYYKKTINPYNSSQERFRRFPATMRNLDITTDVIRRYVGEYTRSSHNFFVGVCSPDVALNRDRAVKEQIAGLVQQEITKELQKRLAERQQQLAAEQQQGQQEGMPPEQRGGEGMPQGNPSTGGQIQPQQDQISAEDLMSPEEMEQLVEDFKQKFVDEKSQEGQKLLEYIKSNTDDERLYAEAFFNFVSFGRFTTYSRIEGDKIVKENVPVNEAYPIPNKEPFIEDHDMFARKMMLSKNQIIDMFDEHLDNKDRAFFDNYYSRQTDGDTRLLSYNQYFESYPDVCEKFGKEERDLFKNTNETVYGVNGNLYPVWHVVWRGYTKRGILHYVNELGMLSEQIVPEDFKFDEAQGHIDIEWIYTPQVYEGYRIGSRYAGIYPIKARPVFSAVENKLPYNGLLEPFPLMGPFSLVDTIAPFQIMRNIFSFHREMIVAKNKMLVLLMPESLIGSGGEDTEDRIYKMAADGVLYYDDSVDSNSIKAQQIRMLNANLNDYIRQMTELIESIKNEAREVADMTAQRYGDIATSAGKGTTDEAISRGSMGTIPIVFVFDKCRCADYQHNVEDAKLAWIDGLADSYWNDEGLRQMIDIPAGRLLYTDYAVNVTNSAKDDRKLEQLRQYAFNAAQNGDFDMAIAAVGDNVAVMKATIAKFNEIKRQHEEQMQQAEQMLKQQEIENKLREITAKGEEDRKTQELRYYYELQMKYAEVNMALAGGYNAEDNEKTAASERIAEGNREIERMKLDLERQKILLDTVNKSADRDVKREQMSNDLKIAKTNKNRYDK